MISECFSKGVGGRSVAKAKVFGDSLQNSVNRFGTERFISVASVIALAAEKVIAEVHVWGILKI